MKIQVDRQNFEVRREAELPDIYQSPRYGFLSHYNFTNILVRAPGSTGGDDFILKIYTPSANSRNYQLDLLCILSLAAAFNLNRDQILRLKDDIGTFADHQKNIDFILLNSPVMQEVVAASSSGPQSHYHVTVRAIREGLAKLMEVSNDLDLSVAEKRLILSAYENPSDQATQLKKNQIPKLDQYLSGADKSCFPGRSYFSLVENLNTEPVRRVNPVYNDNIAEAKASWDNLFGLYVRSSETNRITAEGIFGGLEKFYPREGVRVHPTGYMKQSDKVTGSRIADPFYNSREVRTSLNDKLSSYPSLAPDELFPSEWNILTDADGFVINGVRENDPRFPALLETVPDHLLPSSIPALKERFRRIAELSQMTFSQNLPLGPSRVVNDDTIVTKDNYDIVMGELLKDADPFVLENLKRTPGPFFCLITETIQRFQVDNDMLTLIKSLTKEQIAFLLNLDQTKNSSLYQDGVRGGVNLFFTKFYGGSSVPQYFREVLPGKRDLEILSLFENLVTYTDVDKVFYRTHNLPRKGRFQTVPFGPNGGLAGPNQAQIKAVIKYSLLEAAFGEEPVSESLTEDNLDAVLDKIVSDPKYFDLLGIAKGQKIDMLDQHSKYASSIALLKSYYSYSDVPNLLRCFTLDQLDRFFAIARDSTLASKDEVFLREINSGRFAVPDSLKQRMIADQNLQLSTEVELKEAIKRTFAEIDLQHVQKLPNVIESNLNNLYNVLYYLIPVAAVQSVFEKE